MQGETIVSLATALLCVLAVSGAAASLNSTITADPGDGVVLDYDAMPVSGEHVDALVEGVTTVADEVGLTVERIVVTAQAEGVVDELDAVAEELALDEDARPPVDRPSSVTDWDGESEYVSEPPEADERDDSDSESESWVDRIAALLRDVRSLLVAFGLFAFGLAYRHADDLTALVPKGLPPDRAETDPDGTEETWPPVEPSDEVSRAWTEMVGRLDVEESASRTTAEWAAAAVEAGMDPEAVRTITRTFEAVRYGDGSVTEERVRRVRRALRELDRERGGESA